jgi:hypothetical protein
MIFKLRYKIIPAALTMIHTDNYYTKRGKT